MANILVTNDDGIGSLLWSRLCEALEQAGHTVYGIAPAQDHSWIGQAQTLGREISPKEIEKNRWSLEAKPADCVAIAPAFWPSVKFDAVVSGINIGVNTRLPLVLTSGTVGAASTGAMLGLRAIAFSYAMPREYSAAAKKQGGIVPETAETTTHMINHCVERVSRLLGETLTYGQVYNVNFPPTVTASSAWEKAAMALTPMLQYFSPGPSGGFIHDPKLGKPTSVGRTEFDAIGAGNISETLIDWTAICR